MMKKKFGRTGKRLLLLAGVGLSGLFILEVGQQMSEALELSHIANLSGSQPGSQPQVPLFGLEANHSDRSADSPAANPQQNSAASAASSSNHKPQNIALDFGVQATAPKRQTVALNDGAANDAQQPVSQISQTQIAATRNWNGASFPVENFQAYTSPFGYRSSPDGGYSEEFHYGLDMAAPEGSYVRNWWGGKVVEVTDNTNCGTSVVLDSGAWTHIYCHMEGHVEKDDKGSYMVDREGGLLIRQGQDMPAGARIGRVGMTGRTTGPHLHWGLKYNGNWVDPAYVLRAMYSSQQAAMQATTNRVQ